MNENGKKLNLFSQKRKKSKVSSNQAFDMMESVADKSSVNLLKIHGHAYEYHGEKKKEFNGK